MKSRATIVLLGGILMLLFAIGWTTYGQKRSSVGSTWEYKYVENLSEEEINQIGAAGWEMVGFSIDGSTNKHFYFKRGK